VLVAFPLRLLRFGAHGGAPAELDSLIVNSVWAFGSLAILVATACVGYEQPQQRRAPRILRDFPCELRGADDAIPCRTVDLSETGARIALPPGQEAPQTCRIRISTDFGVEMDAEATRVRTAFTRDGQPQAAYAFQDLDAVQHCKLVEIIFTGEHSWTAQAFPEDRVLLSLWYLMTTFWRTTKARKPAPAAPQPNRRWKGLYRWLEDLT
jgi:hypothetical protein